jgi:hypothetical protein
MIITVNGAAKAAMRDTASYEESQETLALLKLPPSSARMSKRARSGWPTEHSLPSVDT